MNMKKFIWLLPVLALFLMGGSDPLELIRFTIINKSESDIAIQLNAIPKVCCNKADVDKGEFYYLPVEEGSKETPTVKIFHIAKNTYQMQLFYLSTYDPVYGYKCDPTVPNGLSAGRNLRLVVLPCNQLPTGPILNLGELRLPTGRRVGEPSMWKYLPFPVPDMARLFNQYWKDRFIY
jgi:hypothetical protein